MVFAVYLIELSETLRNVFLNASLVCFLQIFLSKKFQAKKEKSFARKERSKRWINRSETKARSLHFPFFWFLWYVFGRNRNQHLAMAHCNKSRSVLMPWSFYRMFVTLELNDRKWVYRYGDALENGWPLYGQRCDRTTASIASIRSHTINAHKYKNGRRCQRVIK